MYAHNQSEGKRMTMQGVTIRDGTLAARGGTAGVARKPG